MSHETPRSLEKDGHRMVLRRTEDSVVLYARSGRVATSHWMDLATAGMDFLPPGTVLDGEAVIWKDGKLDFSAVQSRAASTLPRARTLAARNPASYMVWDVLHHPAHGDITARPYTARRAFLVELLAGVGPPIQVVPSSDDYDVARDWYESLRSLGIEGIVAKRDVPYPAGRRGWVKVRHADTAEARVVGFTGPRFRPRRLALVPVGESGVRLSARLAAGLAARIGRELAGAAETGGGVVEGEAYTGLDTALVVEVLAGAAATVFSLSRASADGYRGMLWDGRRGHWHPVFEQPYYWGVPQYTF
ncbi:hypothetical protein OHA98_42590, partial [Streptomyces sp. NBC_00654]|uniref:ATP-dependent DNA ligase n=1 Tax=Streptomyces sp. NBC_00654 TaxID=2975799 RepID=UPI002252870D